MKVIAILERANRCLAGLPEPNAGARTLKAYQATFLRMLTEPVLDPLRPGDARDTYNHRRAALFAGAWQRVSALKAELMRAAHQADVRAVDAAAHEIVTLLDRLEPILEIEPPLAAEKPAIGSPPSRWSAQTGAKPRRGAGSKKHQLPALPRDWLDRLWEHTPSSWPYRAALAVAILLPCRPAELSPAEADAPCGIAISMPRPTRLHVHVLPAKSQGGRYGTRGHVVSLDPDLAGSAAAYLADLCRRRPGVRIPIETPSTNLFHKALLQLGTKTFPGLGINVTAYLIRAQVVADLKATFGAGGMVAVLCGHGTDRTQSKYGRVEHGRQRRGIIAVRSVRMPKTGHATRAAMLRDARRDARLPSPL